MNDLSPGSATAEADVLSTIRRDGISLAPWSMSAQELAETIAHLDECWVWGAHVASKAQGYPADSKLLRIARSNGAWPAMAPTMDDVVRAPHLLEYAIRCFPIVRDYFGEFPRLYSVNVFWTQPGVYLYPETHDWHRDGDDRKQLGLFLFGTDVTEESAHLYQRGSHRLPDGGLPSGDANAIHAQLDFVHGAAYHAPPPETVVHMTGPAGTLFLEDPSGVHMGRRPPAPRMFAWARWGVSNPPVSYSTWDRLRPCPRELIGDRYPSDPEIQEAIRLVVS